MVNLAALWIVTWINMPIIAALYTVTGISKKLPPALHSDSWVIIWELSMSRYKYLPCQHRSI